MEINAQNSPLTDEQARQLNELLSGLEGHQIDWLSGYMAGWRAAQTGRVRRERRRTLADYPLRLPDR